MSVLKQLQLRPILLSSHQSLQRQSAALVPALFVKPSQGAEKSSARAEYRRLRWLWRAARL